MYTVRLITLGIFLAAISITTVSAGDFWYYKKGGSHIEVTALEKVVSIRLDSLGGPFGAMFAQMRPYLKNDFDFQLNGARFVIYGIEEGYSLEYVLNQLQDDPDVFMANPILSSEGTDTTLLSNQLIVRFSDGVTQTQIEDLNQSMDVSTLRVHDDDSTFIWYVMEYAGKADGTLLDICNSYYESGLCRYAEPNFVWKHAFFGVPDDSYFEYQWHFHNTGQDGGGADCDIDMPEAYEYWEPFDTDDPITIAVVDMGFELDHEDTYSGWYVWPKDVVGEWEDDPVWDDDPSPQCSTTHISCWHGTAVMGMIAAATDNNLGLAGVNNHGVPDIRFCPIKISGNWGEIWEENAVVGIHWAMNKLHRVDVINCSWGGYTWPNLLEEKM